MSTVPSGVAKVAPTGQTLTLGAFWHCCHGVGMNCVPLVPRDPAETWLPSLGSAQR